MQGGPGLTHVGRPGGGDRWDTAGWLAAAVARRRHDAAADEPVMAADLQIDFTEAQHNVIVTAPCGRNKLAQRVRADCQSPLAKSRPAGSR